MLVSIIIPIYNSENSIETCLDSIMNQTYKDLDVLLIDDGSKDSSGMICDRFVMKDSRFRVIHKSNGGVSSARNVGIGKSSGDWILFVDSDDYVSNTFVESFVNKINDIQTNLMGADFYQFIIFGSYVKVEKGRGKTIKLENLSFDKESKDEAIKYLHVDNDAFGYTCLKIYNSHLIKKNSLCFHEDISLSEDLIFTLDYLKYCTQIYVISAANYYYRVEDGILSKRKYDYKFIQRVINLTEEKFLEVIGKSRYKDLILQRLEDSRFCAMLNLFSKTKQEYDKRFIIQEINNIRTNGSFKNLRYKNKSYRLLHALVTTCPALIAFAGIKGYFILKEILQNIRSKKAR